MRVRNLLGLDCGNSSFRIVLGRFDGETISCEVIDQYPNDMIRIGDYDYWDFLRIFDGLKQSMKKAASMVDRIDSIGVCTWGVDFALYDRRGNMLSNPLAYRNAVGGEQLARLTEKEQADLFRMTGILCDKINSVYMLAGIRERMPELFSIADKLLMVPDVFNFMLTGVMQNEPSELSTTQLMGAGTGAVSPEACGRFGIPQSLFSPVGIHGQKIGDVRKSLLEELGIPYDIPVICVPSHDTAAAVLAIPAREERFAFISSGTWSLIGTELDKPAVTDAVLQAGLTNETGAFGKITLLKNSAGMFIIQRIRRELEQALDRDVSWGEMDEMAAAYKGPAPLINVNSGRFFNPLNMSREIWRCLTETGQIKGELDWGTVIQCVYESMACSYALTIGDLEKAAQAAFDSVYIVGGGSKNLAVNQLTAARTGKQVVACGKESTSLGNIAAQLFYFGEARDAARLREIIGKSIECREYRQPYTEDGVIQRYAALLSE